MKFMEQLKADLDAIKKEHPGCSALVASGGGRMRVTMDRYEVNLFPRPSPHLPPLFVYSAAACLLFRPSHAISIWLARRQGCSGT